MKIIVKKMIALLLCESLCVGLLSGCGAAGNAKTSAGAAEGKKTLVIGSGQSAGTLDPIQAYNGWYPIRYGICQTLTKMNNDYSISGWLAQDGYSSNDDNTVWTFTIKDKVTFSNGNKLDAQAVKESLEHVFTNGERGIEYFTPVSIEADGQKLVITTKKPEPILPNKLADPLFSIIDTSLDNSKNR